MPRLRYAFQQTNPFSVTLLADNTAIAYIYMCVTFSKNDTHATMYVF